MSKSSLEVPLYKLNRKRPGGDLGLEIELEGTLVPPAGVFWAHKQEGSLRQHPHGYEYILQKPIKMEKLDEALAEIKKVFDNSTIFPSIRCSTHIHVNVTSKTLREIYNIIGYYYLVEDFLVRTQGPMRCGNLFCLRMSDAEALPWDIGQSIQRQRYFTHFGMPQFKYGALNLAAPMRYGSLEFRFLRPITNVDLLRKWSEILYALVTNAAGIPIKSALKFVKESSPDEFLKLVWNEEQVGFLLNIDPLPPHDLHNLLLVNYDHVRHIQKKLDSRAPYRVPPQLLETDLETTSPFGAGLTMAELEEVVTATPPWVSIPETESSEDFILDDEYDDLD